MIVKIMTTKNTLIYDDNVLQLRNECVYDFFYNLAHDSRPNNDNSLSSQLPIFIVIRRSATYLLPLNNSVIAFYHLRDYT